MSQSESFGPVQTLALGSVGEVSARCFIAEMIIGAGGYALRRSPWALRLPVRRCNRVMVG